MRHPFFRRMPAPEVAVTARTTPISIIESHFGLKLNKKALKKFDELSPERWIDFAKQYRDQMSADFAQQWLGGRDKRRLRLYFEPRLRDHWSQAVAEAYAPTPLLGISSRPTNDPITRDSVSAMLAPLKKHLLLADSLYIRDSFYYCFDMVADSVDKASWRAEPNREALVLSSIQAVKQWLRILIELRDLVKSGALVFMPYYATPSFPYAADAPQLAPYLKRLRHWHSAPRITPQIPDLTTLSDPPTVGRATDPANKSTYFSESDVTGAWLNARILELDPVFPNRSIFDWASNLRFDDDIVPMDLTSDLISLEVLPFGAAAGIPLDDLISMRKNEEVFHQVKGVTASCKTFIAESLGSTSTKAGISAACKSFLHDQLAVYERDSVLRFVDEKPVASICFSLAVGAATALASPVLGVVVGALLTPQLGRIVLKRADPKRRAIGHLQALL